MCKKSYEWDWCWWWVDWSSQQWGAERRGEMAGRQEHCLKQTVLSQTNKSSFTIMLAMYFNDLKKLKNKRKNYLKYLK